MISAIDEEARRTMSPTEQPDTEVPALDSLDDAIVAALSRAPDLTNRALAARLSVAESTCAYRRRRLRESGVIGPPVLEVYHGRLGYGLRAVITVYMSSHSRELVDSFMRAMVTTPHVLNVMHLTGRSDFMITVAVRNAEELRNFILDHITVHRSIRSTETQIIFDMRKGTWIPRSAGRAGQGSGPT